MTDQSIEAAEVSQPELPIWGMIVQGWKAAFSAFLAMPAVMIIAFLGAIAASYLAVRYIGPYDPNAYDLVFILKSQVMGLLSIVLFAPAGVAFHRHILLGEVTASYFRDFGKPRVWIFALVGLLISSIFLFPNLIFLIGKGHLAHALIGLVFYYGAIYLSIRIGLMAPMAALDHEPFQDISQSLAITKGRFWKLFFICLFGSLPFIAIPAIFSLHKMEQGLIYAVINGILSFFMWLIGVALVSGVYAKLVLNKVPDAPV